MMASVHCGSCQKTRLEWQIETAKALKFFLNMYTYFLLVISLVWVCPRFAP